MPLERNTVRFIDNFSTGTRGARCAEYVRTLGRSPHITIWSGSLFEVDMLSSFCAVMGLHAHSGDIYSGLSTVLRSWSRASPRPSMDLIPTL